MSEGRPVRIAVIGVGALGRHHARLLAALPGAQLVAVVDTDRGRAEEVAKAAGCQALVSVADLPAALDAVSVAVPTEAHAELAVPFLDRGVAVLVEKPIARTLAEADAMIAAAERSGALLATGHTERFNPAVAAVLGRVERPRFVEVHRLGTFPDRSLDIDVVFDLMIHDLDLLLATVGEAVVSVEAVGVPVLTGRVDIANARLTFGSGCIANLTASRISRERIRKLRFFQPHSYCRSTVRARRRKPTASWPARTVGRESMAASSMCRRTSRCASSCRISSTPCERAGGRA